MHGFGVEPGDATLRTRHRTPPQRTPTPCSPNHQLADVLLGDRPADVPGATTYDDTVHAIARWRARHQLHDDHPGARRPDHPRRRSDVGPAAHVGSGSPAPGWPPADRIHPADTFTPSHRELLDRLADLDAILDTAPPDWRPVIDQLRSGQLTLDDTTDLLAAATDGQDAATLDPRELAPRRRTPRNQPHPHRRHVGTRPATARRPAHPPITDTLTGAIETASRGSASPCAPSPTATPPSTAAIEWLEHLAARRAENGIPAWAPIDSSWSSLTDPLAEAADVTLSVPYASDVVEL